MLCLVAGRERRQLYDAENHIEACRMYGNIDIYAYYYVDLLVGTPPQRVSVIADTGSGVTAFPCTGCTHCGFDHHIDPAFSFGGSNSADWMPCGGSCHGGCKTVSGISHCTYYQGYTEGSSISGFWFQDWVRLGDTLQHNPPVRGSMGCHRNENKLFYNQSANGIMGIGPRGRNGRTLLQELFQDLNASVFSMCLAEWGGLLVVGGHNESYHRGELQYVTLDTHSGYYRVPLTGMRVDGHDIANFGTTMIDSGTTFTYMKTSAYNSLRGGIEAYCRGTGCGGATKLQHAATCYQLPLADAGLDEFPTVDVLFDNHITTPWEPKSYLYRKSDKRYPENTWCYTFEDDGAHANTVLGAAWMRHKEIIFDMRTMKVGIVLSDCPNFKERPAPPGAATATTTTTTTTAAAAAVPSGEAGLRGSTSANPPSTSTSSSTTTTTIATTTTTTTVTTQRTTVTRATTTTTSTSATPSQAQERIAQTVEGQGAQSGSTSSRSPSVFGDAIGSLFVARPLWVLGIFVGLVLMGVLACGARRLFKKRKFKYEKQKDQDAHEREDLTSGMPPQIVGVPAEDDVGADAFVIGDDDDDADDLDEEGLAKETDNFAYGQIRTDMQPQANPRRPAEEADGSKEASAFAGRTLPDGDGNEVSYFGPNGVDPFGGNDEDDKQFWQNSGETAYQPPVFVAAGSSNGGGGREGEGTVNGQLL